MVVVMAVALGGIYSFHSMTPFVYIEVLGLSPELFALITLMSAFAFFAGSRTTAALHERMSGARLVEYGLGLVVLAGIALAMGLWVLPPSVLGLAIPIMAWTFGAALIFPGATVEALAPFPTMAGAAAALMGFLQMGAGVLGSAAGSLFGNSSDALACVPLVMAIMAMATYYGLRARVRTAERKRV
jgi:DHA1 family bicyclomycin/chloramphenicol resistance-like MFS transporter